VPFFDLGLQEPEAAVLAGLEVGVPVPVPVAGLVELAPVSVLGLVRQVARAVELELGLVPVLVRLSAPVLGREVLLWVESLEEGRPVLYYWLMRSGRCVESARLYFADRFG
jgi:hypothetical protein